MVTGIEKEAIAVLVSFAVLFFAVAFFIRPRWLIFFIVAADLTLGTIFLPRIYRKPSLHYHHDLKKSYSGTHVWGDSTYEVHTNSLGFKDRSTRKVPPAGDKHRILFIGDSFTEGVGYPYEATFPGIIAEKLKDTDFEVLNAGVVSYSTRLYYLKIRYLTEKAGLKFDELFVYIDNSDPGEDLVYRDADPYKSAVKRVLMELHGFLKEHSVIYRIYNSLMYRTRVFYRFFEKGENRAEVTEEALRLSSENMDRLYLLCREHGIKMAIAVYPYPEDVKKRNLESAQALFWEDFCREREIEFINYFPDFINNRDPDGVVKKYFLEGDVHWNARGHRLIAEKWMTVHEAPGIASTEDVKK